jgi:magnesium-transporting ATPase (P-type)
MRRHWDLISVAYLLLAIVGLVGTWYFNVQAVLAGSNFFSDWSSTPAVSSATTDLFIVATVASIFIFLEGRRLNMKYWWLYILGSFITAIAFTFPLFLANRQRKLKALSEF